MKTLCSFRLPSCALLDVFSVGNSLRRGRAKILELDEIKGIDASTDGQLGVNDDRLLSGGTENW